MVRMEVLLNSTPVPLNPQTRRQILIPQAFIFQPALVGVLVVFVVAWCGGFQVATLPPPPKERPVASRKDRTKNLSHSKGRKINGFTGLVGGGTA